MKVPDTLPWRLELFSTYHVTDKNDEPVCSAVLSDEGEYIVHACNLYPELIEALESAQRYADGKGNWQLAENYKNLLKRAKP